MAGDVKETFGSSGQGVKKVGRDRLIGRRGCRRGKVFYQSPATNQTMLWNLFWSNSTVAVIVSRLPPCIAWLDMDW